MLFSPQIISSHPYCLGKCVLYTLQMRKLRANAVFLTVQEPASHLGVGEERWLKCRLPYPTLDLQNQISGVGPGICS